MSNTITINKKVTTVETVPVEIQLPIYCKQATEYIPFYYAVTGEKSMVRIWYTEGSGAISQTNDISPALDPALVPITREEFEAMFQSTLKSIVNSIPKA